MQRSTFRQPLPQKFAADMSSGYRRGSDPASYYELVGPAPAGSLTTTGADMARFMIAHLHAERRSGRRTAAAANRTPHARTRCSRRRRRSMAWRWGSSRQTAMAAAFSSTAATRSSSTVSWPCSWTRTLACSCRSTVSATKAPWRASGRLCSNSSPIDTFPRPSRQEPTAPTAVEHSRLVAGLYASSRRAETTFFATVGLLGQFRVNANADGTLVIPPLTGLNGQPKVWREVAPFVWREVGGKERLAAKIENGRVRFLGYDASSGIEVFVPVPAWRVLRLDHAGHARGDRQSAADGRWLAGRGVDPSPLRSGVRIDRAGSACVSACARSGRRQSRISVRLERVDPGGHVRSRGVRWQSGCVVLAAASARTARCGRRCRRGLECLARPARRSSLVEQDMERRAGRLLCRDHLGRVHFQS